MEISSPTKQCWSSLYHLDSCTSLSHLKQSHAYLLKKNALPFSSLTPDLATKLVSKYGQLRDLHAAHLAFRHLPRESRDTHLYNSLIQAFVANHHYHHALLLYAEMHSSGVSPSRFTFPPLLKACADSHSCCVYGLQLHALVLKLGFDLNCFSAVSLIDMYMKQGCVEDARKVFDNMPQRNSIAWNAVLAGYVRNGHPETGLKVYEGMLEAGVQVDFVAMMCVLGACSQQRMVRTGQKIHAKSLKSGLVRDILVSTALLDMYANCGDAGNSHRVFDEMPKRDLVAWNSMTSCLSENGLVDEALETFVEMQKLGMKPNGLSLVAVLPSIARLGCLLLGKSAHGYVLRNGLEFDEFVMTDLIDVYAKSGDLETARMLFNGMTMRGVVAWSAMIAGCGMHGCGKEALELFDEMLRSGIKPNDVTFIAILMACSRAGLVDAGRTHFQLMVQAHGISPTAQHYACMVDLLGRAGKLDEAEDMIEEMPMMPTPGVWGALLGACKIHGNAQLGRYAADRLFELGCDDAGFYVLLSNIYAEAGMWDEVKRVREMMTVKGLKKPSGWSSIEIKGQVHVFVAGDTLHPDAEKIYRKLEELMLKMKGKGYKPQTCMVLKDVEDDIKETLLWSHSEKLAIAYGLIVTAPGSPIRILKNLRTCEDCHEVSKLISKLTSREIILRDAIRFHRVKDGICSCGDYW